MPPICCYGWGFFSPFPYALFWIFWMIFWMIILFTGLLIVASVIRLIMKSSNGNKQ